MVNANSYYYKAQLTGCGEGDDFLMSFWVRAHIAVNSVVMAPKHNVIDWMYLLFSVRG